MAFDDDWSGIFIRGDNALYYAMALKSILDGLTEEQKQDVFGIVAPLDGLVQLLYSANHHVNDPERQFMKKFEDCLK